MDFLCKESQNKAPARDDVTEANPGVSDGSMSYEDLLVWVRMHTTS